jgi:enterochelin esterase-like enzyme
MNAGYCRLQSNSNMFHLPKVLQSVFKRTTGSKSPDSVYNRTQTRLESGHLLRAVVVDVYAPTTFSGSYDLLLFNDGQDGEGLRMLTTLEAMQGQLRPLIAVGIHCNERRMREYGTALMPDYKGRGDLAPLHTKFVVQELLPWLTANYPLTNDAICRGYMGCSLGGLSAFDVAWEHSTVFSKIGVFSGSLWWRYAPVTEEDPDGGRIIHQVVGDDLLKPGLKFWFQAGTLDEEDDRNNNGVIDAIDDTLDLMRCLTEKGYDPERDMRYLQVEGGRHDVPTWADALPDFLLWSFGA